MKNKDKISSKSGQTSKAVANLPTEHPFTVPNGYFDQFPDQMLRIAKEDPTFQINLTKNNPYSAPEGYFEHFGDAILGKIRLEENVLYEIETLAPSLVSLKGQNPFSVPDGYFNNFKTTISTQKRKFVPIIGIKRILRYAAAACIIGLMFFVYRGNNNNTNNVEHSLATNAKASELSTEAISSYLGESDTQIDISENDELASNDFHILVNIDKETVSQVLTEVSENDMEQFLKQTVNSDSKNIN